MALKRLWIDLQHDLFDMWQIQSAEGDMEYNDVTGEFEYLLIINRTAVTTNVKEKIYRYPTEEDRDEALYKIKDALKANPNMFFLGEDDGSINDDEFEDKEKPEKEDEEDEDAEWTEGDEE